ncbi:DUF3298 and DUF4163 domain-containing protein [Algibacter aquimarinus]|uniref:DUF3298/DUF4163 domain-containing protein n=1 Tax=Algibacter aquimarinus TaxID=1136748 RepID=A0ABP9HBJ6_9FLAO
MSFSILLFSCVEDVNISFEEVYISSENRIEINIPKAKGNKTIVEVINTDIETAVARELYIGSADSESPKTINESINLFNEEFHVFKTDFPESEQIWEAQIDGEVLFQSPEIISVSITSYVNTGGAHGILNITFLNFESTTGKQIPNKNLFTDSDSLKEIVKKHVIEATRKKDIVFEPENFQLPQNIGYTEDGVIFLYNTFQIGPYSSGIIEFTIPFEEIKSYLVFNSTN